ncbi:unnamed protein product, partial [Staurois parvus]
CSVWCVLLERFFFLGRVHVISTGPISTVLTEVRGPVSSYSRMKTPHALTCALLDTDRSHKTTIFC